MEERNDRPLQDQPDLSGPDFRYDPIYAHIEGAIVSRGVAHAAMIDWQ